MIPVRTHLSLFLHLPGVFFRVCYLEVGVFSGVLCLAQIERCPCIWLTPYPYPWGRVSIQTLWDEVKTALPSVVPMAHGILWAGLLAFFGNHILNNLSKLDKIDSELGGHVGSDNLFFLLPLTVLCDLFGPLKYLMFLSLWGCGSAERLVGMLFPLSTGGWMPLD